MRNAPHSATAERGLLCHALLSSDALVEVDGVVLPGDFYVEAHGQAFDAMLAIVRRGHRVDQIVLREELTRRGKLEDVGGDDFLVSLYDHTPDASVDTYAQVITGYSRRRSMIRVCEARAAAGYDLATEHSDYIEQTEAMVLRASEASAVADVVDARTSMVRFWEHASRVKAAGGLLGVRSGIKALDNYLVGFWNEELTVIGGRPSMGKTALLETCAVNALGSGKRVLFFSLEMSETLLWPRILAKVSGIDSTAIKEQTLTRDGVADLDRAMRWMRDQPLRLVAKSGLSIGQIRAIARKEARGAGVDVIFVDYLQKIRGTQKHERRDLEVGEVSTGLAELARELRIPVVVGAQINRGVAARADKRPTNSDLRESGSIENDADATVLIHREAYYRHEQVKSGERDEANGETFDLGAAELIVGKNRNGPTGVAHCRYVAERCLFADGETQHQPATDRGGFRDQ